MERVAAFAWNHWPDVVEYAVKPVSGPVRTVCISCIPTFQRELVSITPNSEEKVVAATDQLQACQRDPFAKGKGIDSGHLIIDDHILTVTKVEHKGIVTIPAIQGIITGAAD